MQHGAELVEREIIDKKRFADFSACFYCGLPQSICNSWVASSYDGRLFQRAVGGVCQYGGGLIFKIMVAQRVRAKEWWDDQVERMMGINTGAKWDEEFHGQFYRWLGEVITWGGKDGGGI